MNPNSPYYHFDPTSIGWLHRRHKNEEEITAADLARLLKADPANGSDPVMVEYQLKHLEGRLKRKRGRKPPSLTYGIRLIAADIFIKERAAEIKAERQRGERTRHRGDLEPCVEAASEVGRWLVLPTGRSLLNAISRTVNNR